MHHRNTSIANTRQGTIYASVFKICCIIFLFHAECARLFVIHLRILVQQKNRLLVFVAPGHPSKEIYTKKTRCHFVRKTLNASYEANVYSAEPLKSYAIMHPFHQGAQLVRAARDGRGGRVDRVGRVGAGGLGALTGRLLAKCAQEREIGLGGKHTSESGPGGCSAR